MISDAPLRPEIIKETRAALEDRRWDDAIFDAFRLVEAHLQRQVGSTLIGAPLVNLAFSAEQPRVRISPTPSDAARLADIFRGSLGFLKGDRSHGEAPAVPCPDEESCLLALGLASFLLDLLDRDENVTPAITSHRQESADTLELATLRTTERTEVLVDGIPADVLSRDGDLVRVRLASFGGPVTLQLSEERRISPALIVKPQPPAQDDNFHLIEAAEVRVYDSATGLAERDFQAVRIRSYEGGARFVRYFPAGRAFSAGEYVGWDWDLNRVADESWVEAGSERQYGWTHSGYFAGKYLGMRADAELIDLQIRPREVRLRPGDRAPVRVIAFLRDGPACWREDVTERANVRSLNPEILYVSEAWGLFAKSAGTTELRAEYSGRLARARVVIAALPAGSVIEWFGGYRRINGLLVIGADVLLANQSDHLIAIRSSMQMEPIARVDMPETAPTGLDVLAVNPAGDLFVRTIWNGDVLELPRAQQYTRSTRIATATEGTAYMGLAWSPQKSGLLIADSAGTIWLWREGLLQRWITLPFRLNGLFPRDDALYLSSGQHPGYARMDWDGRTLVQVSPRTSTPLIGGALLPRQEDVLLAEFHSGRVYSISNRDASVELIAQGFTNPTALVADSEGGTLVANFGGDSISRILP